MHILSLHGKGKLVFERLKLQLVFMNGQDFQRFKNETWISQQSYLVKQVLARKDYTQIIL